MTDTSTNANAELQPISASAFLSRVRVVMGDVMVCDLNSTSRVDAMKDLLKTPEAKRADEVLGYGNSFNKNDVRFLTYSQGIGALHHVVKEASQKAKALMYFMI